IFSRDWSSDVCSSDLRFSFDTGAQQTALFSSFFKKYNQEIKSKYKKVTLKTGGAGGHSQMKGYVINNFKLSIGDSQATLDSVQRSEERRVGKESGASS